MPRDSLRLIHWKTTARQAKLFVRLFDGTPASDWWILLDLQAEEQVGTGSDSTEEHGIILAASLADLGLRAHRGVGLVINGKTLEWLPPRTGSGQRWDILRRLALATPGESSLGEVLEHARPNLGRNASLLIITATSHSTWFRTLPPLQQRGITPTILLLDLQSFNGKLDNSEIALELKKMHFACHLLPRELFDRPEAQPGTQGQWEWRISPLGKAIPVHEPEDHNWRRLAK